MDYMRLIKIDKLAPIIEGIKLKSVMTIISASFIGAAALTFSTALVLQPEYIEKKITAGDPSNSVVDLNKASLTPADMEVIKTRNIFNSAGTLGDVTETANDDEGPKDTSQTVKSSLPLKLLGVIFAGTPDGGLAMIRDTAKQRVGSYLSGDQVVKGVKLLEVYEERIIVDNKGRREYIILERPELVRSSRDKRKTAPAPGVALAPLATGPVAESFKEEGFERQGNNVNLTSQYKENLLGPQMSKVLQDAKAEPNMVNGELQGFKLTRIREGSIYQKAGFQSGDVVKEINGIPLRDAAGAIRLLQSLRQENEVDVGVQRGSDNFNLVVTIQ